MIFSILTKTKHSVHPPSPPCPISAGGVGVLPNFLKKWGLTEPLFLEECCWKRGCDIFRGGEGGCSFSTKNRVKSGMFNDKKV